MYTRRAEPLLLFWFGSETYAIKMKPLVFTILFITPYHRTTTLLPSTSTIQLAVLTVVNRVHAVSAASVFNAV